uniref:Gamma-glutamyltransferase 1 n=1 Tax=Eptatretus burgeri TaxID=7764 RepID=A0A8C4PZX7_EPTBU
DGDYVFTTMFVCQDILQEGGSVVDSAIAALLCLSLFNPQSMGIGWRHFYCNTEVINAREVAPLNASKDMFNNNSLLAMQGGLAIAVPGEIRGYALAHKRHGKLSWSHLFQPAIKLAQNGVEVGSDLAKALIKTQIIIESNSSFCEVFCNKDGKILKEHDIVKFPKLAKTYQIISEEGPDAIYTGTLASHIVDDISKAGGIITLEDLKNYEPVLVENPIEMMLGDYKKNNFDSSEKKALTYYRIVEAFKFAFAKRTEIGDPKFVNFMNITEVKRSTTLQLSPFKYYEPSFVSINDAGTSQVSVLTKDGKCGVCHNFGAKVRSSSLGIIYNNEMDDFSSPHIINSYGINPSPANFIEPGKQPLSSMVPTIIVDKADRVKMVVGAAGGPMITTATALVIINALWFKHDVGRALEQARLHNQLMPNTTDVEDGMDKVVIDGLLQRGDQVSRMNMVSSVQAIVSDGVWIHAASDSRKAGIPAGY